MRSFTSPVGLLLTVVLLVVLQLKAIGQTESESNVLGTWTVKIGKNPRKRVLIITDVSGPTGALSAVYGYSGDTADQTAVQVTVGLAAEHRQMTLLTKAASAIVVIEGSDGAFRGTLTSKSGKVFNVMISRATAEEVAANKRTLADPVPLAAGVPKECSAFKGFWAGKWARIGEKFSLNVPEITSDGKGGCVLRVGMGESTEPLPARQLVHLTPGQSLAIPCGSGHDCIFKLAWGEIWLSVNSAVETDWDGNAVLRKMSHEER